MPPVENRDMTAVESQVEGEDVPAAKPPPVIGIIYPPPEVRNIVDKTASFVARNGPEFETRIRQNELNNPKFNFLGLSDPYHAYYQHKVKEFKEGKGMDGSGPKLVPQVQQLTLQRPQDVTKIVQEHIVPKDPPPEFEFIADPPSISAFDLDVVKLTAQFVARNGRQFLTNLMNREQRNYQFDFLRPQHSLFNYFTKLVEQYTKILIPPKDLMPKLKKECDSTKLILEQVKYRVEWAKHQERERQKEEEAREKERVSYSQIDWHDFVVVETVDFQPNETGNLPPPTTPEEVGARVIAQERFEAVPETEAVEMEVDSSDEEDELDVAEMAMRRATEDRPRPPAVGANTQVQDMEEDSDEMDEEDQLFHMNRDDHHKRGDHKKSEAMPPEPTAPPPPPPPPKDAPQPPPLPPTPEEVLIKKDYNPKAPKATEHGTDKYLVSPITGEKVLAEKIQEHMRIGLLDPQWLKSRDRGVPDKREQEEVYAPGPAISSSLKQLAERRTDIFGIGTEETQIGKKIGEEERHEKAKVIWDGHTASMEKVTQKARENISIEEQIAGIHKVKGLLPDEEKEKIGPAMPKHPSGPGHHPPPPPPMSKPPMPPPSTARAAPPLPPTPAPTSSSGAKPLLPPPRPPPSKPPGDPHGGRPHHSMVAQHMPPGMGHAPIMGMPPRSSMMAPGPPMGMAPRPGFLPAPHMGGPMGGPMGGGPPMGGPGGPMGNPMGGPPRQQQPPPPPPMQTRQRVAQQHEVDEPPSKKAKTEDSLMPEEEFLAKNKGPVMFKVSVPKITDKPEWKLNGQTLNLTLPLTDNVSVIKAKIHESVGMPAGKQKLQFEGLFIKDSNTLAYYNFTRQCVIQLQLKERGGRKK